MILLPFFLLVRIRNWPEVIQYSGMFYPEKGYAARLIGFYSTRLDLFIWVHLIYNEFDRSLRFNDFDTAKDLIRLAESGSGLLMIGFHYGPLCQTWIFSRMGMNLVALMAQANKTDLSEIPFRFLLTNDIKIRGTYPGMIIARKSERTFVKSVYDHKPSLILMDRPVESSSIRVNCLGIQYSFGIFPFKLAVSSGVPVVAVWLSKIRGKGYRLQYKALPFSTIEEGITAYGSLMDSIIRNDPYSWIYSKEFMQLRLNSE